jgi:hypothetical protein
MSHYDPVRVFISSASETNVSNRLIATFNASGNLSTQISPILVHKVTVEGVGTNALSIALYHATTASGTISINLAANETYANVYSRYNEADFNPPVPFTNFISLALTGIGTYRIYYTRL